jgi:extradiol dioxygenase family protein
MDLIRHQHLVFVNMIQPAHAVPVFSESTVDSTDDLYRHLGGHLLWHNLRELDKTLQRRGVRFSMLDNEKLSAQLVSQYLGVKRRQLL